MANTAINNKRVGFNAEAELMTYLRGRGILAERLYLAGKEDEGDLFVNDGHNWIFQLKTYQARTAKGGERPLPVSKVRGWWRDLAAQREAYRAHRGLSEAPGGILVVKVKGQPWDDAMIIQRLGDWAS
jgi:hypothetical protein